MKQSINLLAFALLLLGMCARGPLNRDNPLDPGGTNYQPPSAPSIVSVNAGNSSVTVVWNNVGGASSYDLYYALGTTVTAATGTRLSPAVSPDRIPGLINDTEYAFAVSAVNSAGESPLSEVRTVRPNDVYAGMKFMAGGTFTMGSDSTLDNDAAPSHQVTLSSFHIDSTEVTQASYQTLVGRNPSHFTGDPNRPVEQVSWFDAVLYCNARSKTAGDDTVYTYTAIARTAGNSCTSLVNLGYDLSKTGYRLPTEAEWEYACRAGTTTGYYWGDDSTSAGNYAWFFGNSNDSTHRVATKLPNAWGLYDMAGNVWEWCNDWFARYGAAAVADPKGPPADTATTRVLRGGSWFQNGGRFVLRSASRAYAIPEHGYNNDGFRCVRRP